MRTLNQLIAMTLVLTLSACTSTGGSSQDKWTIDKRADVHVRLGIGYLELNQLEVAQTEIREALKINSNYAPANHAMALLSEKLNQPQKAESFYKKAVSRAPENYTVNLDYGRYLCVSGRINEGISQYDLALANPFNKQLTSTFNGVGGCHLRNRLWDQAESFFERVLRVNPNNSQALYSMVIVHYQLADMLAGRAFLERYTANNLPNAELLLYGVRIEQQMGSTRTADKYARQLQQRFPNSREAQRLSPVQILSPGSS